MVVREVGCEGGVCVGGVVRVVSGCVMILMGCMLMVW